MLQARAALRAFAASGLLLAGLPAAAQSRSEVSDPGQAAEPDAAPAVDAARSEIPIEAARLALTAAAREHGRDSLEIIEPLLDLADAEASAGDFLAAAGDYAEAVRLVETLRGAMDSHLIEPLRGLGTSANSAGDYQRAAEALERALHVTRIEYGLFDLVQVELLNALSRSYVGLGRQEDAEFAQRAALRLAVREYGADSIRMLPAITALASWYHSQNRFPAERALLERKIALLEDNRGKDDPSLVEPLRALALTYRLEYRPLPEGEKALERAIQIHARHPGDTVDLAETLVALGDWRLIFRERVRAFDTYAEAWKLLAADPAAAEIIDELFGSPVPLFYLRPRQPGIGEDAAPEDIGQGFVSVEYSVNELGRVVDLRLVESEPPGVMDTRVIRALREARYRPRIADGEPVATAGLRFRSSFTYDRRNLEEEGRERADL
ncbi:MAG: energy transducer TonB [Gammaproteobacteria bacterium]